MNTMLIALISSIFTLGVFLAGFFIGKGAKAPVLDYMPESDEDLFKKELKENKKRIDEVKIKLDYSVADDKRDYNSEKAEIDDV